MSKEQWKREHLPVGRRVQIDDREWEMPPDRPSVRGVTAPKLTREENIVRHLSEVASALTFGVTKYDPERPEQFGRVVREYSTLMDRLIQTLDDWAGDSRKEKENTP